MGPQRFKRAAERRGSAASALLRLLGAAALLTAVCASGCIYTQLKGASTRPMRAQMEVFVRASVQRHLMDNICICPFATPPGMAADSPWLTSAFQSRLAQEGPFTRVKALPWQAGSDAEAIWYARKQGCDLVMRPSLVYIMDGTGALPTKLVTRARILDARTGQLLWDIKQTATSEPGPDIDLSWNTIVGQPARSCPALADCLAQRFAGYLARRSRKNR